MQKVNRRSAVALGLAAASAAMVKPALRNTDYKDATPWPGVVVRAYSGETPSSFSGFKTVRNVTSSCSRIEDHARRWRMPWSAISPKGASYRAGWEHVHGQRNFVWTCNKNTKKESSNVSMRSHYADHRPIWPRPCRGRLSWRPLSFQPASNVGLLALFGHGAMSDLSPLCSSKPDTIRFACPHAG